MSSEAMKLALEALKQIDEAMPFPVAKLAQAALREALAEQPAQQEPMAWMDGYRNIYSLEEKAAGCPEATIALVPMANHKKTSGSPIKELNCICGAVWEGDELVHLPRPPAQRKPLTDEDCTRIYNEANGITTKNPPITTERIFKAMRAAHGIKENT